MIMLVVGISCGGDGVHIYLSHINQILHGKNIATLHLIPCILSGHILSWHLIHGKSGTI